VRENEARAVAVRFESEGHPPQLTAFFTSAAILASSVAVNSLRAKTARGGHYLRTTTNTGLDGRMLPLRSVPSTEKAW